MVDSVGADSLSNLLLISDAHNIQISSAVLIIGVCMFLAGIVLMLRHLKFWQTIQTTERDTRVIQFEFRKFRRRGIVACLLSIAGSSMAALWWAREARVFAFLTLFLFAAIVGALGLAIMDLILVSLKMAEPDDDARKKMG